MYWSLLVPHINQYTFAVNKAMEIMSNMKQISCFFSLTLIVLVISGCAATGSKDSFAISSAGDWKFQKAGIGNTYYFSCKKLRMDIRELIVKSEVSAAGPIIPIIPMGTKRNNEGRPLYIQTEFVGFVENQEYQKDDFVIDVMASTGNVAPISRDLVKINEKLTKETLPLWVQYRASAVYDIKLGESEDLTLSFEFPFTSCKFPPLRLSLKSGSNNEFIIAPGS